ncbi:DUF86 domain-containing protein [Ancrocorticia populi]|uniref:Toxin-antitoxin system antitoxin subunit n=1 Tax=Ancrocorticia populi TaxID=2175228 RepID=A0A2V1K936_9ACTO|nr:HepT-like ribonuclease domain-containing protein [Ancrocorticia populi]MDN6486990.1 DUF86 domain-containing protein [Ancrocorticia sp.]PWF25966.1 toxin-antitoxin system antitoxin subunit [Ancrocorticia populi]
MSRGVEERIGDIQSAIARSLRYVDSLDDADTDIADMAVDAIERNIAVIGEAVRHLPDSVTQALPEIDWAAIRGMRNILIHEYFGVDNVVLREVVTSELGPLNTALKHYLEQGQ